MILATKKQVVGLDIDCGEIRAVELSGKPGAPKLVNRGLVKLPEGAVEDGIIYRPEEVCAALGELWSGHKFKSKNVLLGVSNQEVLVRVALFPKVPEEKLGSLIRYQAQDHLPLSLDSVILDYTVIGETMNEGREMYEVILVAARRDMLNSFLAVLSGAKLKAWDIDVSSLVLLRIVPEVQHDGAVVLVDIANGQSNILIVAGEMPRLARRVPVRLKDAAAQLNVSVDEMFFIPGQTDLIADGYMKWIDGLIREIRSSISYYQAQSGALAIEEIMISGKGARAPGLVATVKENLKVPVKNIQPFSVLEPKGAEDESLIDESGSDDRAMDYSIAFSLALRGLED